jgi:hypothetical protein
VRLLVGVVGLHLASVLPARAEKKPRLDAEAFDKRFSSLRGTKQLARETREAKIDLAAYLGAHFDLTPVQIRSIRAFPKEDLRALDAALDRAVAESLNVKLVGSADGCQRLRPRLSKDTLIIEIDGGSPAEKAGG